MSVSTHLTSIASRLILTEQEKSSITTSITTLNGRMDSYFGASVTSHFKFGSYPRVTILPRKVDSSSDVDYMVVFSTSDGKKKPQTYLDRLKKFAENKYSTSEISQSHPTIVLSLNHIRFELVPAVYDWGYSIPSPSSSWTEWMPTDPSQADKDLTSKNVNNNYQIKPLVRIIKYWNALVGYPFSSYSLEQYVINLNFWNCTSLKDYFYYFWSQFSTSNSYSETNNNKIRRAKEIVGKAKELEDDGYLMLAEIEIKKLIIDF